MSFFGAYSFYWIFSLSILMTLLTIVLYVRLYFSKKESTKFEIKMSVLLTAYFFSNSIAFGLFSYQAEKKGENFNPTDTDLMVRLLFCSGLSSNLFSLLIV